MSWLDSKYINLLGTHLTLFKKTRNDLWNFRCPICGDSEKDRTKARGYIFNYKGDYIYKCQNCGDARPFSSLLYVVSNELHKQYKMECFKENSGGKTRIATKPKPEFKRRDRTPKADKPKIRVPKQLDGMKPISQLPDDHFMRQYAMGRGIPEKRLGGLFWASNMRFIADRIGGYEDTRFDKFPRLLLPFINRDGVLTHIQGRAVGDNVPKGSRYYTLEVEESPKVYGLHRIDDSKLVKVVEGPIDSLFLTNSVGMGGADVPWHMFDPNNTVFVWDNEPRSKQIIKRMRDAAARGYSVCVWGSGINQKDINDMVLNGRSATWVDDYITSHSFRGLKAKMAIAQYEV